MKTKFAILSFVVLVSGVVVGCGTDKSGDTQTMPAAAPTAAAAPGSTVPAQGLTPGAAAALKASGAPTK